MKNPILFTFTLKDLIISVFMLSIMIILSIAREILTVYSGRYWGLVIFLGILLAVLLLIFVEKRLEK